MALFSIGHDCAHASFSTYPLLNNGIGRFLASVFLFRDSTVCLFRYHSFHMDIDSVLSVEGSLPLACCHFRFE